MCYHELFQAVSVCLERLGIETKLSYFNPISETLASELEKEIGLPFPPDYIRLITGQFNGFRLQFFQNNEEVYCPQMLTAQASVDLLVDSRVSRIYTDEEAEDYGFPYVDDVALAKSVNAKMKNWLPVITEPNGDQICLELNRERYGAVVFDNHEWLDGGTGDNGSLMANSFTEFFRQWATHCFQIPSTMNWPDVLEETGVNWRSELFDSNFKINS